MKKVILITGASSGMGKETAIQLLKEGHIVYGAARRVEQMQDLVSKGGYAIALDVSSEQQIINGVAQIIKDQGRIDVLWNNAGYGLYGAIEDIKIEDARRQFEVNLFGLARITQEVLPFMRKAGQGLIINTSSMGGKMYTPLGAWYHATKHALEGWSDCLRLELKGFNVNVVVLEPGAIATEFGAVLYQPILDHSGKGVYAKLAHSMAKTMQDSYGLNNSSSPSSVISKTISKIINSNNPKTRYRIGKWAKPMVWMRIYLGDKFFDKVVMSQLK
jgi:short-subunit dehydrogenase